jgi:FixJ family two-component response regulator
MSEPTVFIVDDDDAVLDSIAELVMSVGLRALMDEINHRHLPLAVIVIGRDSELAIAIELVRFGAFDFLEHPFTDRRLRSVIRCAIGAVSE